MATVYTPATMADHLRHLAADALRKMDNEYMDRQLIAEDLISQLLDAAEGLDGHHAELGLMESGGRVRLGYDLDPRESFGTLKGEPSAYAGGPCPYTHAHTRRWCGFATCRES